MDHPIHSLRATGARVCGPNSRGLSAQKFITQTHTESVQSQLKQNVSHDLVHFLSDNNSFNFLNPYSKRDREGKIIFPHQLIYLFVINVFVQSELTNVTFHQLHYIHFI